MRSIVFMRHAKAEKADFDVEDFDRKLSERGKSDANEKAKSIYKLGFKIDVILSSPAKRTEQTAKIVADVYGINSKNILFESGIYEAEISDLIHVIREMKDKYKHILIVGHNPSITSIAGYLTGIFIDHVSTSGFYEVSFNKSNWRMINKQSATLTKQFI